MLVIMAMYICNEIYKVIMSASKWLTVFVGFLSLQNRILIQACILHFCK